MLRMRSEARRIYTRQIWASFFVGTRGGRVRCGNSFLFWVSDQRLCTVPHLFRFATVGFCSLGPLVGVWWQVWHFDRPLQSLYLPLLLLLLSTGALWFCLLLCVSIHVMKTRMDSRANMNSERYISDDGLDSTRTPTGTCWWVRSGAGQTPPIVDSK